jgi:hypothetical protein
MIVDDDGEPWPRGFAIVASGPKIELGVISLPDLIGARGLAAIDQIISVSICFLAIVGERGMDLIVL